MTEIIEEKEIFTDSKVLLRSSCNYLGYIIFLVLSLLTAIFLLWACIFQIDVVIKGTGNIVSSEKTTITSNVEGIIKDIYIIDGTRVNKGDALYVLDSSKLESSKSNLEKNLDKLTEELDNYIKLKKSFKDNVNYFTRSGDEELFYNKYSLYESSQTAQLSMLIDVENNINELNNKIDDLENNIKKIDDNINDMTIHADRDGYIALSTQYKTGDKINLGTTGISIVDDSCNTLKVNIYIDEVEVSNVEENQEIKVKINALDYKEYGEVIGKVKSVSSNPIINNKGMSYYLVNAEIPNSRLNSHEGNIKSIKDGMSCTANIISSKRKIIYYLLDKLQKL